MCRGGQNEAIGPDPTVFPKSGVILEQLYTGGWSAVVDASKFFYQFTTHPQDRKYLGCIHPRDPDKQYVYRALPMGAAASPSLAGRYGAAFLQLLRTFPPEYQGTPICNTWWKNFSGELVYNPHLGHDHVLIGEDGLSAALVWAHCDDFFIHSPTKAKGLAALSTFLDAAVDAGMLCHPGKLTPPAQSVKYTGLIFDTRAEPMLLIPEDKWSKALAMTVYVCRQKDKISLLALSVVGGVLESLVEATPTRIGHTYLRSLQETLHPLGWDEDDLPYFSFAKLSDEDIHNLGLWQWLL
jgi:hypothetical protein